MNSHIPLVLTSALPATGGSIGSALEDFRVDEIPAYLPSGSGDHLYVRIQKRGLPTPDAIRIIARTAGIKERDVGSAGMKDKHAVTSQWLSLPVRGTRPPEEWSLPEQLQILEVSRHNNKLRTGHLAGNRFSIRLVNVDENAADHAAKIRDYILEIGLLNYFGAQRFGRNQANLARAIEWLRNDVRLQRFELKLYPSVIQSEIFNRYLTLRLERNLAHLLKGEVVRLEGSRAVFAVEDPVKELPRYLARDIHLTGPIAGPKMKNAEAEAKELEDAAISSLELGSEHFEKMGAHGPGTRRDLVIHPKDFVVEVPDASSLILSFELPAGAYATQLIREFTRTEFGSRGVTPRTPGGAGEGTTSADQESGNAIGADEETGNAESEAP